MISVLGFQSELVEYKVGFDAKLYIAPTPMGLVVSAVNGQRFYTNNHWPNAVVLKIENAQFNAQVKGAVKQSSIDGAK